MKEQTVFEKIISGEIPTDFIYRDKKVVAFLDAFPFEKGHALVIPVKPYVSIWDMTEDDYAHLQRIVHKIACTMKTEFGVPVAIYQRNEKGAGQEVPHVHVHLVPRFTTEQSRPIFNDIGEGRIDYDSDEERLSFKNKLSI